MIVKGRFTLFILQRSGTVQESIEIESIEFKKDLKMNFRGVLSLLLTYAS